MLEITPGQWEAIAADSRREFVARLAAFLRAEVPSLVDEPQAALLTAVEHQIARGVAYGLESERAVSTYVLTAAWLGPDFDEAFPPAAAVLNARDMDEQRKAEWLESWSIELFKQLERD